MTLPAYLQNLPKTDRVEQVIGNLGTIAQPYVSIAGGRFTLIDAAGGHLQISKLEIDAVIIDLNPHKSKVFFGEKNTYNPDNPSPPICWSDNGVAPSVSASQPQNPTCNGCRWDAWGSRISALGSAVKACNDQQKIAVYVPEYSPQGLWLLRIPPGSFSNFKNYLLRFQQSGMMPYYVWTRVSFEPGVIGTLTFTSPGHINETVTPMVEKLVTSHAADHMIGLLDKPREGMLPAPQTGATTGPFVAQVAAASSTSTALPSTPTAPLANTASPSDQPRKRGPRRQAAPVAAPEQAPFRPTAAPSNSQFGIQTDAPQPPEGLQEALDDVFKS